MFLRGVFGFCAGAQSQQAPERSREPICPTSVAWNHGELSLKEGRSL
jgi:hypothetical protein